MGGGRQEEWGPAGGGCGRRDNGTTWRAPPSAATDAAAMRKRDGWGTAVPRRRLAWISREREVRGPGAAGARSHRLWGKSGRRRLRTPSWARTRGDGPPAGSVSSAARGGWAGRGVAPRSAAQPSGTRRWRRKRAWTKAGNDAAILNENYSLWKPAARSPQPAARSPQPAARSTGYRMRPCLIHDRRTAQPRSSRVQMLPSSILTGNLGTGE